MSTTNLWKDASSAIYLFINVYVENKIAIEPARLDSDLMEEKTQFDVKVLP
jgi:hypothetical protein